MSPKLSCTQGGGRGDSLAFPELQVIQRLCVFGFNVASIRTLQLYVWRLPEEPCTKSLRPFALELGPFAACGNRNTRQSASREPSKSPNLDDYSCLPVSWRMRLCRALPALRECQHRNRFYRPERKFIKATVQLMGKIFFETVGAQQGRELGCFHVFLISESC